MQPLPKALLLEAQPVERVWGGQQIAQHLGLPPQPPIGELWLAYEQNRLRSGPLAGQVLSNVLPQLGAGFLGATPVERYGLELPLLVKFLDAEQWLSVQVHPDDAYAHRVEAASGFHGKTEAWAVVQGSGEVVYGPNKTLSKEALRQGATDGSLWDSLQRHTLAAGDVLYVPAGTIHALGPGMLIYEVQQRSDLTYRIYDYGRPRELHLGKALEVSQLSPTPPPKPTPWPQPQKQTLLACEAFVLEHHTLAGELEVSAPPESFLLLTLTQGHAQSSEGPLGWGDTLLIGANQTIELSGQGRLLGAFVPSAEHLAHYPASVRV